MVDQVLPHQSQNLIALIISFLAFVWGWGAFGRFWAVLHYRYAVLTENTVMLRGLGGGMEYFTNTMPSHSRSILHTRNSTAAQDVKFMYLPFFIYNLLKPFEDRKIQGKAVVENMPRDNHSNDGRNSAVDEDRDQRLSIPVIETASKTNGSDRRVTFDFDNSGPNGFLNASFSPHPSNPRQIVPKRDTRLCGHVPVWCATQSTILVLYGLKLDTVKRFFRYSIKANKLFTKGTKYRDKPQKIEAKSKKSKHKKRSSDKGGAGVDGRHVYAEVRRMNAMLLAVRSFKC